MNKDKLQREIYRSTSIINSSEQLYPLMCVEISIWEDDYDVFVYDIGFEPPYFDVSNEEIDIYTRAANKKDVHTIIELLKRKNIFVENWEKVKTHYLYESNAIIRQDIRANISEIYRRTLENHTKIREKVGIKILKKLSKYNGYTARIEILYKEEKHPIDELNSSFSLGSKSDEPNICSYMESCYMMFRTPRKYGYWGLVAKGGLGFSILIYSKQHLRCEIYSQYLKKIISKGEVIRLIIRLYQKEKTFKINCKGITIEDQCPLPEYLL